MRTSGGEFSLGLKHWLQRVAVAVPQTPLVAWVRAVWWAYGVLVIGLILLGLPYVIEERMRPCAGELCQWWQTPAERAKVLEDAGISLRLYAYWTTFTYLLVPLLGFGIFALTVWRKSSNWVAHLLALAILTCNANLPNSLSALALHYPWVGWLIGTFHFLNFALFTPALCAFPDGRFVPGWGRWLILPSLLFALPFLFVGPRPELLFQMPAFMLAFGVWEWVSNPVVVGILVYRYRTAPSTDVRKQIWWVLLGSITVTIVTQALSLVQGTVQTQPYLYLLLDATYTLSVLFMIGCLGVAMLVYGLFEVGMVVHRTLVYGGLTLGIVLVYGMVVAAAGVLTQGSNNLLVPLVATGVVALALQPLRVLLQRGANRLIYGQRDEPYAVVAGLGKRLESTLSPAEILPTITQTVAQTLRLPYASLQLAHVGAPVAVYGQPGSITERFSLIAQGEQVGQLELSPRQGDSFSPTERRLLQDLSRHIASAAKAVQLSDELQRSREALVLAREEERKRLRRDLHDGLGPTLASQTLRLDAAAGLVEQNPQAAQTMLGELKAQTQETIAEIRRLVQGLRPPSLDEHGLGGALHNLAHQYSSASLSVEVWIAEPLPPLPAALEVAAYRIASEALTNVVRHAQASKCSLRLEGMEALELSIEDDGRGILEGYTAGVGLRSMGERARELGGTLEAIPLEKGTRIFARIPLLEI